MAEKQVQTECNLDQGYAITPGNYNINIRRQLVTIK